MLTDADLKAIEDRTAAAMREPWGVIDEDVPDGKGGWRRHEGIEFREWKNKKKTKMGGDWGGIHIDHFMGCSGQNELKFIAAARSDVPALVAEVRRLKAMVDGAVREAQNFEVSVAPSMPCRCGCPFWSHFDSSAARCVACGHEAEVV